MMLTMHAWTVISDYTSGASEGKIEINTSFCGPDVMGLNLGVSQGVTQSVDYVLANVSGFYKYYLTWSTQHSLR